MKLTTLQNLIERILRDQGPLPVYQLLDQLHHKGGGEALESLELNGRVAREDQGRVMLPEKQEILAPTRPAGPGSYPSGSGDAH